jgi:2-polyprenyl-3-methyl-5-hydroxy-6-metoxy-1,4-benzoquinol methylase
MGDVWAVFSELDGVTQERLAGVLETRGADAQQQAMRHAFLGEIDFPHDARVLEVGCGTGVLTRQLAGLPDVSAVVGVDLSPFLLARARKLAASSPMSASHPVTWRCSTGTMRPQRSRSAITTRFKPASRR